MYRPASRDLTVTRRLRFHRADALIVLYWFSNGSHPERLPLLSFHLAAARAVTSGDWESGVMNYCDAVCLS